ncbi:MAG: hypothetical protein RL577_887 [Bacteroidota bacterium]|jgi:hypothetical protein
MVNRFIQRATEGWKPFLWLLLLQLVLHLPHLFKPASGNHVWRQCNSLALAKNFADESMDIRYPRIDKRYGSDGICGPSFVGYEYGLAILYKVFGFHENLFRAWSFALCLAVVLGWFQFLSRIFPKEYALMGAASLFGFPEFYFHSIGAIPDLFALAAAIWGLNAIHQNNWGAGFLLLTLAAATKLYFLLAWVYIGAIYLTDSRQRTRSLIMGLLSCLIAVAWYVWASRLNAIHGLWEFLNETRIADSLSQSLQLLLRDIFIQAPVWWLGPFMYVSAAVGLFYSARSKNLLFFALTIASLGLYLVLQKQFEWHGYYTLMFVPLWSALAVKAWVQYKVSLRWVGIIVFLSVAWSISQMERNFYGEKRRVSATLLDASTRSQREALSALRTVWLVGPDPTGCVNFYYTGAKGYPWYSPDESRDLLGPFAKAQSGVFENPIQGIVTDQPREAHRLANDLGWKLDSLGSVGEFTWFGLGVHSGE